VRDMEAKDVQEFFERVAVDWDTMRLAYYDERVIERMAAVSGVNEGMIVADVGTGTGFVAAGIAPRVGRVLAVDNSPAMLEVARVVKPGGVVAIVDEVDHRHRPTGSGRPDFPTHRD
jgi:ubiquinone/menaquinone biosynthesis C-methylase UbiE